VGVPLSSEVVQALSAAVGACAYPEVCSHLHVVLQGSVVLQWFDAFDGPCYISQAVGRESVVAFAQAAGMSLVGLVDG
jgi:hypothetical protein